MELLYAFHFNFVLYRFFLAVFILILFLLFSWLILGSIEKKRIKIIAGTVATFAFIIIIWSFFIAPINNYYRINQLVQNNETSVVEGSISYLKKGSTPAYFTRTEERIEVNGVSFSYRDDNYYGYCFFMDSPKNILDEENEFIIEYVYDKFYETNIICFIYKSTSR